MFHPRINKAMYIYIYVNYMYNTHVFKHDTHWYIYIYIHIYICIDIYVYLRVFVCLRICIHVYAHVHVVHVYVYICKCTCIWLCICNMHVWTMILPVSCAHSASPRRWMGPAGHRLHARRRWVSHQVVWWDIRSSWWSSEASGMDRTCSFLVFFLALLQATCASNGPLATLMSFCSSGCRCILVAQVPYMELAARAEVHLPFVSGADGSKTAHGNWMELVGWVPKLEAQQKPFDAWLLYGKAAEAGSNRIFSKSPWVLRGWWCQGC